MPTFTPNLNLAKPLVNNATDQDLWGGELNNNMDILDTAYAGFLPLGVPVPYLGATEPTGFIFCYGQSLDTTTYANLFAVLGYTCGGSGSNFNMPDLRGRGLFGKDDMGGTAAGRVTSAVSGIDGLTLGAPGGDQNLMQHTHTVTDPTHAHTYSRANSGAGVAYAGGGGDPKYTGTTSVATAASATGITVDAAGGGVSQNMPPAMIINWIMKTGI